MNACKACKKPYRSVAKEGGSCASCFATVGLGTDAERQSALQDRLECVADGKKPPCGACRVCLEEARDGLRKALEFYADPASHRSREGVGYKGPSLVASDGGRKARTALGRK